jgi:hypothetical protein
VQKHLNNRKKKHHLPGAPSFSNVDITFVQGWAFILIKGCSTCGVNLHSFCAAKAFQEALATGPDADEGFIICSVSCLYFSKIEGLTIDVIKAK